jgi:hypothetical protein
MIIELFKEIAGSYFNGMAEICYKHNNLLTLTAILAIFIGILILVVHDQCAKLLIYNHCSILISAIGWYILASKLQSGKAIYFLVGSFCAQITFIVTYKYFIHRNLYIIFILWIVYFPILDIAFGFDSTLFICLVVLSIVIYLAIPENIFSFLCISFIGSFLISFSLSYVFQGEADNFGLYFVTKYTVVWMLLPMIASALFHFYFMRLKIKRNENKIGARESERSSENAK